MFAGADHVGDAEVAAPFRALAGARPRRACRYELPSSGRRHRRDRRAAVDARHEQGSPRSLRLDARCAARRRLEQQVPLIANRRPARPRRWRNFDAFDLRSTAGQLTMNTMTDLNVAPAACSTRKCIGGESVGARPCSRPQPVPGGRGTVPAMVDPPRVRDREGVQAGVDALPTLRDRKRPR